MIPTADAAVVPPDNKGAPMLLKDVSAALPKFAGDGAMKQDVHRFFRVFETLLNAAETKPPQRLCLLRGSLTGMPAAVLADAKETDAVCSYEALKAVLIKRFNYTVSIELVYLELRNRRWNPPTQSLELFVQETITAARRAAVPELEVVMIIIDHLSSVNPTARSYLAAAQDAETLQYLVRIHGARLLPTKAAQPPRPAVLPPRPAVSAATKVWSDVLIVRPSMATRSQSARSQSVRRTPVSSAGRWAIRERSARILHFTRSH